MENPIVRRLILIVVLSSIIVFYFIALVTDLKRKDGVLGVDQDKGSLTMEEVTFYEGIGGNRTLRLVARKVTKSNDYMNGEGLFMELIDSEKGIVLSVEGEKGSWNLTGGEIKLKDKVRGVLGKVSWEGPSLAWKLRLGEIEVADGVTYKVMTWCGKASRMLLHLNKGFLEFIGEVEIRSGN